MNQVYDGVPNNTKPSPTGRIFDIQRFSLHDGPGIRTTVFFKGCPLRCLWCHNPESIDPKPELAFYDNKCIGCGRCVAACPTGALRDDPEKGRVYDRELCRSCWTCARNCPNQALVVQGREYTVEDVVREVISDLPFYKTSGGGVTLSGGEPTLQFDFCLALLQALEEKGLHTALDTSGFVAWEKLAQLLPFVNLLLYDLKQMDPEEHLRLTGVPNGRIIENLHRINEFNKPVEIRVPIIPGYTDSDENILAIGCLVREFTCVKRVKLLAYHKLGMSKPWKFNQRRGLPEVEPPGKQRMDELRDLMASLIGRERVYM
ncbi:MAG: glycyl-radical enzyme activating protein [Firmicutes bacterium]|nr:glycyl-radical enzyme activating protein [Bacillota bacterium]